MRAPDELRVAALQMRIADGDADANMARVRSLVGGLVEPPDLLVLPELWTQVYMPDTTSLPHERSAEALDCVRGLCREFGFHAVAGSLPWMTERGLANRSWVVNDAGQTVGYYDKAHLFSRSGEDRFFAAGDRPFLFDLGGIPCGVLTCYDMRFCEFSKCLSLAGARLLFAGAQWPLGRGGIWEPMLRMLAANCQVWLVAANIVGESSGQAFLGHSAVVSPWGDVVASLADEEAILCATIRLSEVDKSRENTPIRRERRPELYRLLTE